MLHAPTPGQALIKLCAVPVTVHATSNPFRSPTGQLPYLQTGDGRRIGGYTQIVQYLRDEGFRLQNQPDGRSDAYSQLLSDQLHPALQYQLWGEPAAADQTRLMYAKRTPFPFSFWYPQAYIRRTDRLMQALEQFRLDDKLTEHNTDAMLLRARQCLNLFEAKLAAAAPTTVLGAPSELDATLFAYLAVIQNVLPHNNVLRTHLNECKRLGQFVQSFRQRHFGADDAAMVAAAQRVDSTEEQRLNGTSTTQDLDDAVQSKWVPQVLAGTIACIAMSLFAYRQGIFRSMVGGGGGGVGYDGGYDDDDEEEDDELGDD